MPTPIRVRGKNTRDQSRKVSRQVLENGSSTKPRGRPLKLMSTSISHSATSSHSSTPSTTCMTSSTKRGKVKNGSASPVKSRMQRSPLESLPLELLQTIFLHSLNLQLPLISPYLAAALSSEHVYTELILNSFSGVTAIGGVSDHEPLYPDLSSASLQTILMSRRWFTLDLLKKCQGKFVQQIAEEERRNHSRQIIKTEKREKRRQRSSEGCETLWTQEIIHFEKGIGKSIRIFYGNTGASGTVYTFEYEALDPPSDVRPLAVPESATNSRSYQLPQCQADSWRETGEQSLIPDKLLHGPWTEEKLDLLELLCDAGATVDWINTSAGEVAERGFEEAILEGNLSAVRLLTREPFSVWRQNVGVRTDIRHLRLAVMKAGCRQEIVEELVCRPLSVSDLGDEEILAWAVKVRAEGNEMGQWVLDQLNHS